MAIHFSDNVIDIRYKAVVIERMSRKALNCLASVLLTFCKRPVSLQNVTELNGLTLVSAKPYEIMPTCQSRWPRLHIFICNPSILAWTEKDTRVIRDDLFRTSEKNDIFC